MKTEIDKNAYPFREAKISVIITAHNYAKYLPQCIDSALNQNFDQPYEVIVVNDGSTDNTEEVLSHYENKIKVITLNGVGLAAACNRGIEASTGQYIIRLDADDYFDENILLIESSILDKNSKIHMVYPDYHQITRHGDIIDYTRLLKINDEVKLLDRSPLAAGAMYRRECYNVLGGYDENLKYQEDYDFWVRFIDKFQVYNVNLPLIYYRKHGRSMSDNKAPRMEARRYVKKKFVLSKGNRDKKKILAFIPAMSGISKKPLQKLAGKPVMAYTIEEALKTELIDRVIVSTEDVEVAETAKKLGAEIPFLRPISLAKNNVSVEETIKYSLKRLNEKEGYVPDIIVNLPFIAPLRKEKHITEAIDTMLLYDTDSVISVVEDLTFHWKPGLYGLTAVGYQKRLLKEDKETIYKENGAIYVVKKNNVMMDDFLGKTKSYIEMFPYESIKFESEFDQWIIEKMLNENYKGISCG